MTPASRARWLASIGVLGVVAGCAGLPPGDFPRDVRHVMINGADIGYVERGAGDTVILVHGVGTDLRIWHDVVPHLAARYRVIAYSRRHHAPNAWPDDGASHTLAQHERDLAALIPALGVAKAHIVGVSLGGQIAGRLAVDHPEVVRSLVLNDSLLALPGDADSRRRMQPFWQRFESFHAAAVAGNADAAPVALVDWLSEEGWNGLAQPRKAYYRDNARALLHVFGDAPAPPTCERLGRLTVPALVIVGEQAPTTFQLSAQRLAQCLPATARHAVVPHAAHFWYADNPAAGAQIILRFLDEQSRSR
jgi:pimeloyl-ACP methyl ester carboxylesterase